VFVFFFFFQAEDGIRDKLVTGVQTCALPIWLGATPAISDATAKPTSPIWNARRRPMTSAIRPPSSSSPAKQSVYAVTTHCRALRSEERRVGKECRTRGSEWE